MGKSRRKNPIFGTSDGSEKQDKRLNNRRLRQKIRQVTNEMAEVPVEETLDLQDVMPTVNETSDPLGMSKDGKRYIILDDTILSNKMMRK